MSSGRAPIQRVVTSGTFSLDGGTWEVDNNVWIVGDDHEVVVIDAAHSAEEITAAIADRRLVAVVCTHASSPTARAARRRGRAGRAGHPRPLTRVDLPLRPELSVLFSGDTLFQGGPGATGRSFSSFDTIIASIRDRLLTLPPHTQVRTAHGDSTSIGAEAPHLQE